MRRWIACFLLLFGVFRTGAESPFDLEVQRLTADMQSPEPAARAGAAEALGYLRATAAAPALVAALQDEIADVRRNAALSLAWCGRREILPALFDTLGDADWSVGQAATVAIANLTGQDFRFDALANLEERRQQAARIRAWWQAVPPDGIPVGCAELLDIPVPRNLACRRPVAASTTYKGPASALTDPEDGSFWQTKAVPFPQHVTVDLGTPQQVAHVQVLQHSEPFRLTDYEISVGDDGTSFVSVLREKRLSPVTLAISFAPRTARYVRVTSHGSVTPTYPTTFLGIEIYAEPPQAVEQLPRLRAARALGTCGGPTSSRLLAKALAPYLSRTPMEAVERQFVQTALRALGRTGGEEARQTLCAFLAHRHFARYAADALGELRDGAAVAALVAAYPRFARPLSRQPPPQVPADDIPRFDSFDRMYETAYSIAAALSQTVTSSDADTARLRDIAPLLLANLPGDFDGMMLYEQEAGQRVTAHLLECGGMRRLAMAIALREFGAEPSPMPAGDDAPSEEIRQLATVAPGDAPYGATWLCALARPGEFTAELRQLLRHDNGWIRINAAKALLFAKAREAGPDLAGLLAESPPEAAYGYNGKFLFRTKHAGQDEYNAPAPCWREAFARALAVLGGPQDVPMLRSLLEDERNVIEVQTAAAEALAGIGGKDASEALRRAAAEHPFHSVRLLARERLSNRGLAWEAPVPSSPPPVSPEAVASAEGSPSFVFLRGPNPMPNDFSIDIWRQTYSTTDAGPAYRIARSLWRLDTAGDTPAEICLVDAGDGWIADCEVSWDGQRVVFARRGGDDDPWWHIHEMRADGSDQRQLTRGPYHDVGPAYLPDGRIVFSTTRIGARDEYHGYPANGLATMQADGSDIHCIGFNVGRDDEPAVMADGRIVFGRLELFYSRLKTERTLHAAFPDGTGDLTLYGPERRAFWQQVTRLSKERWWQESGPRHRVLRLTQPQPFGPGQVLCVTTGGLTIVGPGRFAERILPRWQDMAVTSPFPMPDGRIVCAATKRVLKRAEVDLGLYFCDPASGALSLLHNDPGMAEFEPRPLLPRQRPPSLTSRIASHSAPGTLLCDSAFHSRDRAVRERGRLLRIVEGIPPVARHHTHTSRKGEAWKNHTGTLGRVLGTVPLAADGSFHVTVPADRLLHCQILDSDRRVVGNQLIWMYARPGEARSCVGCHEAGDMAPPPRRVGFAQSSTVAPLPCLPTGGEFLYRAKLWQKGTLPDEGEERTRTVRAVNLLGRY